MKRIAKSKLMHCLKNTETDKKLDADIGQSVDVLRGTVYNV